MLFKQKELICFFLKDFFIIKISKTGRALRISIKQKVVNKTQIIYNKTLINNNKKKNYKQILIFLY